MSTTRRVIRIKRRWLLIVSASAVLFALLACRNLIGGEVAEAEAPIAPTDLVATLADNTQTQLAWNDQSNNETGFIVRRTSFEAEAAIAEMARPPTDSVAFLDVTTGCDSSFQYLVQAYNDAGTSEAACIQTQIVCNEQGAELVLSECGTPVESTDNEITPTPTPSPQATPTLANTALPTATNTPTPFCGDGICGVNEDAAACASDCPTSCGDGLCTEGEDAEICTSDCPTTCGDGLCTGDEDAATCGQDCPTVCGDNLCTGDEDAGTCEGDCAPTCGDGLCTHDEDAATCNSDCESVCGDSFCTGGEDAATCSQDCESVCGDSLCTGEETNETCESDCPAVCGDGVCNGDESFGTCSEDCPLIVVPVPFCGDGICNEAPGSCPTDCLGGINELDPDFD